MTHPSNHTRVLVCTHTGRALQVQDGAQQPCPLPITLQMFLRATQVSDCLSHTRVDVCLHRSSTAHTRWSAAAVPPPYTFITLQIFLGATQVYLSIAHVCWCTLAGRAQRSSRASSQFMLTPMPAECEDANISSDLLPPALSDPTRQSHS